VARRTSPQQAELAQNSELSQQVHDYQDAVSVIHRNPRLALEKLRAYRRKWPRSAIGEEADLREIEALLALGRRGEAAHAARAFVRGYPSSARTPEMQRIADSVPSSARFD
jgi:TolA-binding protein